MVVLGPPLDKAPYLVIQVDWFLLGLRFVSIQIIDVLPNKGSHIVGVECHPSASILDTRYGTLVGLPLHHTAGTGVALAGNPLVGGGGRDGGHQHEHENGD